MSKPRRQRHQTGYVFSTGKGWALRYRDLTGKQCSEFLHARDSDHRTKSCKAVLDLRDAVMAKVNAATVRADDDVVICAFWQSDFLPFVEATKKPSTIDHYKRVWTAYCEPSFKGRTFGKYRTKDGSDLLTSLTTRLGKNSLSHVRSLCSGLFQHAVNRGLLERNPWREVKILAKVRPAPETKHYTLEEIEDAISACVDRIDAQVVLALSFFAFLRPGEIAALKWEDIDDEWIHIRRSAWGKIVGTTKTTGSVASVPLLPQVKLFLELWRQQCGGVTAGFVLVARDARPVDIKAMQRHVIRPRIEKAGLVWKPLYAGRRGGASWVINATGDVTAGKEALRHKTSKVSEQFYIKSSAARLRAAMPLLAAAVEESSK